MIVDEFTIDEMLNDEIVEYTEWLQEILREEAERKEQEPRDTTTLEIF